MRRIKVKGKVIPVYNISNINITRRQKAHTHDVLDSCITNLYLVKKELEDGISGLKQKFIEFRKYLNSITG